MTMNDMRAVIVPKSDQLNADDLLAGPITITVTNVTIRPGTEQPVSIFFDGDGGKPYKCCKSMARVLVHCWGPDASAYVGRSMTLYCDPKVKWGGMAVGGIRISHISHIKDTTVMALTETKGSRKPFTVKPLVVRNPADELMAQATAKAQMGYTEYEGFFKSLTNPQRALLKPHHENLKSIAKSADDEAARIAAEKTEAETEADLDAPFAGPALANGVSRVGSVTPPPADDDDMFPGDRP